ncbi:MAG: hypothetical protein Q9168_004214, partial [Polycauliona sp. 1 TL-2023]
MTSPPLPDKHASPLESVPAGDHYPDSMIKQAGPTATAAQYTSQVTVTAYTPATTAVFPPNAGAVTSPLPTARDLHLTAGGGESLSDINPVDPSFNITHSEHVAHDDEAYMGMDATMDPADLGHYPNANTDGVAASTPGTQRINGNDNNTPLHNTISAEQQNQPSIFNSITIQILHPPTTSTPPLPNHKRKRSSSSAAPDDDPSPRPTTRFKRTPQAPSSTDLASSSALSARLRAFLHFRTLLH